MQAWMELLSSIQAYILQITEGVGQINHIREPPPKTDIIYKPIIPNIIL